MLICILRAEFLAPPQTPEVFFFVAGVPSPFILPYVSPQVKKCQVLLFSATVPSWVRSIANKYTANPLTVDAVGKNVSVSPPPPRCCFAVGIATPSLRCFDNNPKYQNKK